MSLNFREKRQLQKTVAEQQAALRGGNLSFREKRQAQKAMQEALAKLGAGGQAPAAAPSLDGTEVAPGVTYREYPDDGRTGNNIVTRTYTGELRSDAQESPDNLVLRRIQGGIRRDTGKAELRVYSEMAVLYGAKDEPRIVTADTLQEAYRQALAIIKPGGEAGGDAYDYFQDQAQSARYHMEQLHLYVVTHGDMPWPSSQNPEEGEAGMQMLQLVEQAKKPGVADWLRENFNPDNMLERALAMQGEGPATVDNLQAALVESSELPEGLVPGAGQVVMNAHRPLAGHQTGEGPSINGRHYALVNLASSDAQGMIEQNRKLDAVVLVTAGKEAVEAAAIQKMPHRYRSRLDSVAPEARASQVRRYAEILRDGSMTHAKLTALLRSAAPEGEGGEAATTPSPIDPSKMSPGDTVEWRNENGTIRGNYRGLTDDGRAMIVWDGGKSAAAPVSEVFAVEEEAPAKSDGDAAADLASIRAFIPYSQFVTLADLISDGEEKGAYREKVAELKARIEGMPVTYEQDGKGMQAIAYLHYFSGGNDYYITEKDMDGNGAGPGAFGYAMAQENELGYISIPELVKAGVELDLYFTPRPLAQVVGGAGAGGETTPSEDRGVVAGRESEEYEAQWAAMSVSERERVIQQAGFAGQMWAERHARGSTLLDMQVVVREGVLDVLRSQGEPDGQPAPDQPATLTAQAVRGDFHGLGLPEFINKLKEAYSADEDLEGAKEAAIGYLTTNRAELEEAA